MILRLPSSFRPGNATFTMSPREYEILRDQQYSFENELGRLGLSGEPQKWGDNWVLEMKLTPQTKNTVVDWIKRAVGRKVQLTLQAEKLAKRLKSYGLMVSVS